MPDASDGAPVEWSTALANWRESVAVVKEQCVDLGRRNPHLFGLLRSWPPSQAEQLTAFLRGRRRMARDIAVQFLKPHQHILNQSLPSSLQGSPPTGWLLICRGSRVEVVILYGEKAELEDYQRICSDLTQIIVKKVRGCEWPFGVEPAFVDACTFPRLLFDLNGTAVPLCSPRFYDRDDQGKERFFETAPINLTSRSVHALIALGRAADTAAYPGPKKDSSRRGVVAFSPQRGLDSNWMWPRAELFEMPPTTESKPAQPENDSWPPDGSWHFKPGLVWFRGKRYPIAPKPSMLLKRFLKSGDVPIGKRELFDAAWTDEEAPGDSTVYAQVSTLRKLLKEVCNENAIDLKNPLPYKCGGWSFKLPNE